jgi:TfoX/Sxy family transcriptional regulator of competence genes
MAYWQVPAEVLEDAEELRNWSREALAAARPRAQTQCPPSRPSGRR